MLHPHDGALVADQLGPHVREVAGDGADIEHARGGVGVGGREGGGVVGADDLCCVSLCV
jgi:hypothetical protein